jgi:hypothetical protein
VSGLIVHSPGLYTTVQDTGRDGFYEIGMPPSGALDQFSHRAANLLVGNPEGAATLEATYIGPRLEFTDDRVVAVTGADAPVSRNGEEVPSWTAIPVRAGDVLSFAMITAGARLYIAVSGGVDVPEYLGSSAPTGRSPRTPTGSATGCAAASWTSSSASSPSARAATRRTSSTSVTPSARSRCPAGTSRSCCSMTPSPAAATPRSAR